MAIGCCNFRLCDPEGEICASAQTLHLVENEGTSVLVKSTASSEFFPRPRSRIFFQFLHSRGCHSTAPVTCTFDYIDHHLRLHRSSPSTSSIITHGSAERPLGVFRSLPPRHQPTRSPESENQFTTHNDEALISRQLPITQPGATNVGDQGGTLAQLPAPLQM